MSDMMTPTPTTAMKGIDPLHGGRGDYAPRPSTTVGVSHGIGAGLETASCNL
jgi:hypothetical protein